MLSALVLGILLISFTLVFSVGRREIDKTGERRIALLLAQQMMEEIKFQDYQDQYPPDNEPEPRSNFDDVDDYHNWSKSPPQYMDGVSMDGTGDTPNYTDYQRSIIIQYIDDDNYTIIYPLSPLPDPLPDSKLIIVKVSSTANPKHFDDVELKTAVTKR